MTIEEVKFLGFKASHYYHKGKMSGLNIRSVKDYRVQIRILVITLNKEKVQIVTMKRIKQYQFESNQLKTIDFLS